MNSLTAGDIRKLGDGLHAVESVAGDEARQAVGQGLDRLMRNGESCDLVDLRTLRIRAMALAYIVAPAEFGGRTLRQVIDGK